MTHINSNTTPSQPDDSGPRDILDLISEAVAGITDAEIEERLRETLDRAGYTPPYPPASDPGSVYEIKNADENTGVTASMLLALVDGHGPHGTETIRDRNATQVLRRGEPHPAGRPHRRRRPSRRGHWQAKVFADIAVVVIVGAAALAGTFFSSGGPPVATAPNHQTATATTAPTAQGSNAGVGEGYASPTAVTPTVAPSATSTQSGNGASPTELCRELFGFSTRPGQHASRTEEYKIFQQLSSLAGGPGAVRSYCTGLLEPWAMQQDPGKFLPVTGYSFPSDPWSLASGTGS